MTELEEMMTRMGFRPFRYRPSGQAWRVGWYHPQMMPNPRAFLEPSLGPLEIDLRPRMRPSDVSSEAWQRELARRRGETQAAVGHA
jgi:hypothetical protein